LKAHLPEKYEALRIYCDILPYAERPGTYPFGGIVVNLGVSTDCHRDPLDAEGICGVIPFTRNCKGGGLCLYEARLVFNL